MDGTYRIERAARSGVEVYILGESSRAWAEIAPEKGNNCFAFHVLGPVLESVGFDEFLKSPTACGIPVLFPFPNRIRGGQFKFRGENYTISPPRHGLVRDKAWKVIGAGASEEEGAWVRSAIESTDYPEQILEQFPFPFRLEVTYRLKDGCLAMDTLAQNTGGEDMPLGFGIHPYFRRPSLCRIQVPARKRWELVDNLPTGRLLPVDGSYDLRSPTDIRGLQLDDIYTDVVAGSEGTAECVIEDIQGGVQTVIEFKSEEFPNVVVYTPPEPRQALCIEPNTCPTDGFNLQERGIASNVIVLKAGESISFSLAIRERETRL